MNTMNKNIITEEIRKMIPNILLLIGIWWISNANQKNDTVIRLEVQMQQIGRRLDKIEAKMDVMAEGIYPVGHLKGEVEELRGRIERLEQK